MSQTACNFVSGESIAIDHTPASAVTAGDVVVQNGLLAIAKSDIAANALGALHMGGVWEIPLADSHASIPVGTDLFWDADGDPDGGDTGAGCFTTTDTGVYAGKAIPKKEAAAGANAAETTDATVRAIMAIAPAGNEESS